jgi:hypothetical protein
MSGWPVGCVAGFLLGCPIAMKAGKSRITTNIFFISLVLHCKYGLHYRPLLSLKRRIFAIRI